MFAPRPIGRSRSAQFRIMTRGSARRHQARPWGRGSARDAFRHSCLEELDEETVRRPPGRARQGSMPCGHECAGPAVLSSRTASTSSRSTSHRDGVHEAVRLELCPGRRPSSTFRSQSSSSGGWRLRSSCGQEFPELPVRVISDVVARNKFVIRCNKYK